jgi:hypothetical protein
LSVGIDDVTKPWQLHKIKRQVLSLLADTSAFAVTTMLDFYALPKDFPGSQTAPAGHCYQKVAHLEQHLADDIADRRFIPYIQLHEFEALLFTSPESIARILRGNAADITAIRGQFHSPEEIDDDPQTSPSHRIKSLFPAYQKTLHASLVIKEIGIPAITAICPHFQEWLRRLADG